MNVSEEDIERLGLRAPNGAEIPEMEVTEDDIERFGLTAPTADAGSAAGTVTVTPEERHCDTIGILYHNYDPNRQIRAYLGL